MMPHGGGFISILVGFNVDNIGIISAWRTVSELGSADAAKGASRVQDLSMLQLPLQDTMLNEWHSEEAAFAVLSNDPGAQQYVKKVAAFASAPYSATSQPPPVPANSLLASFANPDTLLSLKCRYLNSDAQLNLLAATLALRAFDQDHGTYPDSLNELTPHDLASVPQDPFAPGHTLCYKKNGQDYLLYSVGPDGVDDGGKPIFDPAAKVGPGTDRRYNVVPTSKGDIVAGVDIIGG